MSCRCGHAQGQHTREFKINRGTMPKGMSAVESKADVSHTACSMCGCTGFINKEWVYKPQVDEQQQMNTYEPSPGGGIEPTLVAGEQVFWRRDLTKGFLKKKVTEVQMITSRAVRVNQGALDLQTIDKIEIANKHSRGRGRGTTYSMGGRGGAPRVHFSEGESRSRQFGDMHFFSQGQLVFTVKDVEDASGIKRLIKAVNPHIK